jgi:hypothetical protein
MAGNMDQIDLGSCRDVKQSPTTDPQFGTAFAFIAIDFAEGCSKLPYRWLLTVMWGIGDA